MTAFLNDIAEKLEGLRKMSAVRDPHVILRVNIEEAAMYQAAPDLLAAVKALMEQKTCNPIDMTPNERAELWSAHAMARAAIARAEGR